MLKKKIEGLFLTLGQEANLTIKDICMLTNEKQLKVDLAVKTLIKEGKIKWG